MNKTTTEQLLQAISTGQSLKTWSLIMTFFGDAVVPRGACVASTSLQAVMTALHIDGGAVRTALSRLTNDGQLVREKSGRNSFYSLAPTQTEAFEIAERRIYSPPAAKQSTVNAKLVSYVPGVKSIDNVLATAVPTGNGLAIVFDTDAASSISSEHTVIDGVCNSLPPSIIDNSLPKELLRKYDTFNSNFNVLNTPADQEDDLSAVACRCLLIHEWRRLVLKTPAIPYQLLSDDSNIKAAHDNVARWYEQLLTPSEQWLNSQAINRDGKLGPPQPQYTNRLKELT